MKISLIIPLLLVSLLMSLTQIKAQQCGASGELTGPAPPSGECNTENNSECCEEGKPYATFTCSPPFENGQAHAVLTLNSFAEGGDGGDASKCDGQFHSNDELVVALSTGWINGDGSSRCNKNIRIGGNGKSVVAKVVDECDSTAGCDSEHAFQPPCRNNVVDGSRAVWEALGVAEDQQGELDVVWSDA